MYRIAHFGGFVTRDRRQGRSWAIGDGGIRLKAISAQSYRATPGTSGVMRRPDRLLAAQLHQRGVPLEAVENAFVLAAARRMIRPADAAPLSTIRSLAYF